MQKDGPLVMVYGPGGETGCWQRYTVEDLWLKYLGLSKQVLYVMDHAVDTGRDHWEQTCGDRVRPGTLDFSLCLRRRVTVAQRGHSFPIL